jgi:16S rRNA (cytidine1402-2'-O)-methyltransferase
MAEFSPLRWVEPGVLYVVGTPIGNLSDWSPRAQTVLQEVDLILCEDTRVTGLLCHHYDIKTPMLSFHAHNTQMRLPQILRRLDDKDAVALVSDRGMPTLSDPGQELVDAVWQRNGKVTVIPGPSAAITAYAASGFEAPFTFWGFVPRTGAARSARIQEIVQSPYTAILYEAPHHMQKTLNDLKAHTLHDVPVFVAREMTKRHEEFIRTMLSQITDEDREWRGEIVLVLGKTPEPLDGKVVDWEDLDHRVKELVTQGLHQKEAIRQIASKFSVSKRELYQFVVTKKD